MNCESRQYKPLSTLFSIDINKIRIEYVVHVCMSFTYIFYSSGFYKLHRQATPAKIRFITCRSSEENLTNMHEVKKSGKGC